jgi:ParB/RepB/Spo0J family partition protein
MNDLARSIGAVGQKIPGLVRPKPGHPGKFILVDGERRWRACGMAGVSKYKAIIRNGDLGDLFLESVVANFAREGHSALETARALARVKEIKHGESNAKIARYFGQSEPWVVQHLSLLRLPDEVHRLMSPPYPPKKRLSYSVALLLVTLPPEDQIRLAHEFHIGQVKFGKAKYLVDQRRNELQLSGERRARPGHQYLKLHVLLANFDERLELLQKMSNPTLPEIFDTRDVSHCEEILELLRSCGANIKVVQQAMRKVRDDKLRSEETSVSSSEKSAA